MKMKENYFSLIRGEFMEIGRYIKASIGGFIGGILFALPWLLIISFSPISIPFLAFLIATGVDQGYRKLKGRVNRQLPKFIIGITALILILVYFIYFPILFGSIKNIFILSYWKSMIKEIIISLICAIVGIYKKIEDILFEIGLRY